MSSQPDRSQAAAEDDLPPSSGLVSALAGAMVAAVPGIGLIATGINERSAWTWLSGVGFLVLAVAIVCAGIRQHRQWQRAMATRPPIQPHSTRFVLVTIVGTYSTVLSIGLLVYEHVMALRPAVGWKYELLVGLALGGSLYMALHGRRYLRAQGGPVRGDRLVVTPGQALLVVTVLVLVSACLTWLVC